MILPLLFFYFFCYSIHLDWIIAVRAYIRALLLFPIWILFYIIFRATNAMKIGIAHGVFFLIQCFWTLFLSLQIVNLNKHLAIVRFKLCLLEFLRTWIAVFNCVCSSMIQTIAVFHFIVLFFIISNYFQFNSFTWFQIRRLCVLVTESSTNLFFGAPLMLGDHDQASLITLGMEIFRKLSEVLENCGSAYGQVRELERYIRTLFSLHSCSYTKQSTWYLQIFGLNLVTKRKALWEGPLEKSP